MALDANTKNLLSDPAKRRSWVLYQFKVRGSSLSAVARSHGYKPGTVFQVFNRNYPKMELFVANELEVEVAELFPDRYDDEGLPTYGWRAKRDAE